MGEELTYKVQSTLLSNEKNFESYLEQHRNKSALSFIACGSVDDGKSTLIGRLLYESKAVFEDQFEQLLVDSKKNGSQGDDVDFSLLVDGLSAEREQGITIDVAYRFFSTSKRKFTVIDAPGHEQYTRNMVTGASNAELAIILIDARKGIQTQTRRHVYLCRLLGIKKFVVTVNKMDMVNYEEETFVSIVSEFNKFADEIELDKVKFIPVSALKGDNVCKKTSDMPWYDGDTLLDYLEKVEISTAKINKKKFRLCVQSVNRASPDFRGFSGKIVSGKAKPGDEICIIPSGKVSKIDRIVTFDGDLGEAVYGQSVTLTLKDDLDCSRGQVICSSVDRIQTAEQFNVNLIWMSEEELIIGRQYMLKMGPFSCFITISKLKYKINVNNMAQEATKTLGLNYVGVAEIISDRPIPFEIYNENPTLGGFILICPVTNLTIGAGLINFALNRSKNLSWHAYNISKKDRSRIKNQKPCVLWLTGLSGSGKSTIANELEKILFNLGRHTYLLDGDNLRLGLNKDLGFSESDRIENLRRVGEIVKLMIDSGLIVIAAFVSPFKQDRDLLRKSFDQEEFIEIFVDTPLELAERRDVKGLYRKARSGELKNFTGISSPYEPPENPEIHIKTVELSAEEAALKIISCIPK